MRTSLIKKVATVTFGLMLPICVMGSSDIGKAPDRGYVIQTSTENGVPQKSGQSAILSGDISLVGKAIGTATDSHQSFDAYLEEDGVQVRFFFPDMTREVTSGVSFTPLKNKLKFKYNTGSLQVSDLNSLHVLVTRMSSGSQGLLKIQSKLELRIATLNALVGSLSGKKPHEQDLAQIEKYRDRLRAIADRLSLKLAQRNETLAEARHALLVDNRVSRSSMNATVMGKFRVQIDSSIGSAIQGQTTDLVGSILNLRSPSDNSSEGLRVARFYWNGALVKEIGPEPIPNGSQLRFSYATQKLLPENSNIFSAELYNWDEESADYQKRVANLAFHEPVAQDSVAPKWLAGFTPDADHTFVKDAQAVEAKVVDDFGFIERSAIQVNLSGALTDGSSYGSNVTSALQITSLDQGHGFEISGDLNPLPEGQYTLQLQAQDLASNAALPDPLSIPFWVDRTPPQIALGVVDHYLTRSSSWTIPVVVVDSSPTETVVKHNGVEIFRSSDIAFNAPTNLSEGVNQFEISSIDAANNTSQVTLVDVVLDTVAPTLSNVIPSENTTLQALSFPLSAKSSEALSYAKVNGLPLTLDATGTSISGVLNAISEGVVTLNWEVADLAGNVTSRAIPVQIVLRVLNGDLIGIVPNGNRLEIRGAVGAARPGISVSASSGLFNSGGAVSNPDGSFMISLSPFSSAVVSATDSSIGRTDSVTVTFNSSTILSGLVKDTDNRPLPGATVSISGTSLQTLTDGSGAFVFRDPVATGDQTLVVDGGTVNDPCQSCGTRKFTRTSISISIGVAQSNVLQRPIFLTPLLLDGTETQVVSGSSAVVTSPHAPGVSLAVSANSVVFPDGNTTGVINIASIPAEVSAIPAPQFVKPTKVIALEPSGTRFSQPVEVSFPNENNLPPGVELAVLSMNSKKGIWELDGVAKVTDNGQSVVTKPGQGITHFSEIIAVPIAPIVKRVGAQNIPGADVFNGSLLTTISLPSYRAFGANVAPSLSYRSSWAAPSIVMSNLYDIPEREVTIERETTSQQEIVNKAITYSVCGPRDVVLGIPIGRKCWDETFHALASVQYDIKQKVRSWYEPRFVDAQFYVGPVAGQKVRFAGGQNGFPRLGIASYAFSLVDPTSGDYLSSGVYPYRSSYEVHLDQISIISQDVTKTITANFDVGQPTYAQDHFEETRILEQVFPQDVVGTVVVQNHSASTIGRGWKIGSVQRILNPAAEVIAIEEGDGSTATYGIKNTIETLFDASASLEELNLSQGVGLSSWPNAQIVTSGKVYKANLAAPNTAESVIATLPASSGQLPAEYWSSSCTGGLGGIRGGGCGAVDIRPLCAWRNYSITPRAEQLIEVPGSGEIIGTGSIATVFKLSLGGDFSLVAGNAAAPVARFYDDFCSNTPGVTCGESGSACSESSIGTGTIPYAGFGDGSLTSAYLNKPMGIALALAPSTLVIADYGNNRVRRIDLDGGQVQTIAGNGQTFDSGDGSMATSASLFHPRGVAYDAAGNLYISTERGYIRKVDSTGRISTIAGLPAELGGSLSNEVHASKAAFLRPTGLAVDNEKNHLYVADTGNHRVFRVDLNTRMATVVAGGNGCNGNGLTAGGLIGDSGSAVNATLCNPSYLGLDDQGNLLIADVGHNKIRRVVFQNSSAGVLAFAPSTKDLSKLERAADGSWTRTYRNGSQAKFDSSGRQIEASDRTGRRTIYSYDVQGNLVAMTDPSGRVTEFAYSGGYLSAVTDPAGRQTKFYNLNGLLTQVRFPDGSSRSFAYDGDGLLLNETNERGLSTEYQYNAWKRLSSVVRADGAQVVVNDSGSATLANDFVGGSVGVIKPYGTDSESASDSVKDPKSIETKFAKDFNGYITTIEDPDGKKTIIRRDEQGNVVGLTRPDETSVAFVYDPVTNDLISQTDTATGISTSQMVDSYGNITSRTNARGYTSTATYDPATGLLLSSTSAIGQSMTYAYFPLGLTEKVTDSSGRATKYTYDSVGNIQTETDPAGGILRFEYDAAGNVVSRINQKGQVTAFTYDSINRLLSVTTAAGTPVAAKTEYTYLPTGELSEARDPHGNVTRFEYDALGRLKKKVDPHGGILTREYDANGNIVSEVDPNGNLKTWVYDDHDHLVQRVLPDSVYTYAYNDRHSLISASNQVSRVDLAYDDLGRLKSSATIAQGVQALPGIVIQYEYDVNGNRIALHEGARTTVYSYDSIDRLTSITNSLGEAFGFEFDVANRLVGMTRPGGGTRLSFDNNDFVTAVAHSKSNGTLISRALYTLDAIGQKTQIETLLGIQGLQYDGQNQLTGNSNADAPEGRQRETFAYDGISNRSSDDFGSFIYSKNSFDKNTDRLIEDGRFLYVFDANGNLQSKQAKGLNGETVSYTYSSENQLVGVRYFRPGSNSFESVLFKEVAYIYDALGRRVEKRVVDHDAPSDVRKTFTRRYVYDGDEILLETDELNRVLARYTHSNLRMDDVLAVEVTAAGVERAVGRYAKTYTYLKDAQGSVTEVSDSAGSLIQRYIYSAFGELLGIRDANAAEIMDDPELNTSYSYTGRERDSETGLYYYRARFYDPSTGRFLQKDPAPGQLDRPVTFYGSYLYVANNPFNRIDPTGKWDWLGKAVAIIAIVAASVFTGGLAGAAAVGALGISTATVAGAAAAIAVGAIAGAAAGALAGGLVGGLAAGISGDNFSQGFWKGAEIGAVSGGVTGAFAGYGAAAHAAQSSFQVAGGVSVARAGTCLGLATATGVFSAGTWALLSIPEPSGGTKAAAAVSGILAVVSGVATVGCFNRVVVDPGNVS